MRIWSFAVMERRRRSEEGGKGGEVLEMIY